MINEIKTNYHATVNHRFLLVLWAHLPICLWVAWMKDQSMMSAIGFGLFILSLPTILVLKEKESLNSALSLAIGLVSFSALLIHLSGGMTELHFHVFTSLGLLIILAQPLAVLAALVVVAVHHLGFFFLLPTSLFNKEAGIPILLIHVVFALATGIPAIYIANKFKMYVVGVRDVIDEVQIISEDVSSDSKKMSQTATKLSQSTSSEAASIEKTSAAIDQLNKMIAKNTQNSFEAAKSSTKSLSVSNKGKDIVEQMVRSIADIKTSNNQVSNTMEINTQEMTKILDIMKAVTEKTKVIHDIVFQTKLLSFNASVEAARAGENGKGFAVVAEEVGNLAAMSGKAAKEINELLNTSLATVEAAVTESKQNVEKIITDASRRVDQGVRTAEDCRSVLFELDTIINQISSAANMISLASEEQSHEVQEISRVMGRIDEAVHSNTAIAVNAADSARSLETNSDKLEASVRNLMLVIDG